MTDREKLVELISDARINGHRVDDLFYHDFAEDIADHLVTNGVTVQQWISVEDELPESQKPVLVCAKDKTFGYKRVLKAAHVGYHECSTEDYEWQEYEGGTEYDEEKDRFWIPECWYETNAIENNGNWLLCDDYEITHWMPLPEPPKEE